MTSYKDRCVLLGIQTIEHRHKGNQSLFVSKLLKNELYAYSL